MRRSNVDMRLHFIQLFLQPALLEVQLVDLFTLSSARERRHDDEDDNVERERDRERERERERESTERHESQPPLILRKSFTSTQNRIAKPGDKDITLTAHEWLRQAGKYVTRQWKAHSQLLPSCAKPSSQLQPAPSASSSPPDRPSWKIKK